VRDGDARIDVVRYYQDEGKVGKGAVNFDLGEDGKAVTSIFDFQILGEIPKD